MDPFDDDFAETAKGEPVFDGEHEAQTATPPPPIMPPGPADLDATEIAPAVFAVEPEGTAPPETHAPVFETEDPLAATALDGFSRESAGRAPPDPSRSGKHARLHRPQGAPPPQSDTPLYVALVVVVVLIVAVVVGLIVAVLSW